MAEQREELLHPADLGLAICSAALAANLPQVFVGVAS
jgi:hypothetical protein